MKSISFAFFVLTLIAVNQGCSSNSQRKVLPTATYPSYQQINFGIFIDKQKNDTLDFYEALLNNKDFVNIFEHSEFYFDDVTSYLKNESFNNMQAAICICAMQNLSVKKYVKLCSLVLLLYDNNKLTDGILEHAITPDFLRKRIIIDNYNDPDVVKLLRSIENDKKVPNEDFKKSLPQILSGESSKQLKKFDEDSNS